MQPNILIVEDDDRTSRMYEKILTHAGYHTVLTPSVAQAMEQLEQFDPDIIFLDWWLEDGNGNLLLDVIRPIPSEKRPSVVVISGHLEKGDLEPYEGLVETFFNKPISVAQISDTIKTLLPKTQQRQKQNQVICKMLSPDCVHLSWVGRISQNLIDLTQQTNVTTAKGVVFDLTKAVYKQSQIESKTTLFPKAERVYYVSNETTITEFISARVTPQLEKTIYSDLYAAMKDMLEHYR